MSATFIDKVGTTWTTDDPIAGNVTVLPAQNVQAGKFLVLIGRWVGNGGSPVAVSSITDTAGNTWTACGAATNTGSGINVQAFYCRNALAHASNVVTITYASTLDTRNQREWECLQYTFDAQAAPVDVYALTTAGGGGSSMTSAAFNVAGAGLAVTRMHGVPAFTAGSGWTLRSSEQYHGDQDKYFAGAATGETATMNGGSAGPMLVMVFKETSSGPVIGVATETDTALALAGKQIRDLGLATETDTALALTSAAGLPFNTAPYEFGQRTGLDVADFSVYASTALNVSVYAATDVLLTTQLFAYTESTGSDGRLTRKTHASLVAGTTYIFVAVTAGGALVAAGRITAT